MLGSLSSRRISFLCIRHHDSVGEVIMFLGCPIVQFDRSDVVTTISHERLEQFVKADQE